MMSNNNNDKVTKIKEVRDQNNENEKKNLLKKQKIFFLCILVIVLLVGGILGGLITKDVLIGSDNDIKPQNVEVGKASHIYELLNDNWYYQKNSDELIDSAIKGMTTNSEDPHTAYLSSKETKELMSGLNGNLVGIGIQYAKRGDSIIIETVIANSPASHAGIKVGDEIISVDGHEIRGLSLNDVQKLLKGKKDSKVTIVVDRNNETKTFDLKREVIDASVYLKIKNQVGILKITTFGEDTADAVYNNLLTLKKDHINNLVIDLRDNGGGYVKTALEIASLLIGKDKVVLIENSRDNKKTEIKTDGDKKFSFNKVEILINRNTASASEILTLALRKYLPNCEVIGEQSYGKGTVQNTEQFRDGSMLKYTVAEWLGPNGESINDKGVTPDEVVKLDKAITHQLSNDQNEYHYDQVGDGVKDAQIYLKFLGYKIDREDGYFSKDTKIAVEEFEKANNMSVDGIISPKLIQKLSEKAAIKWYKEREELDTQLNKAIENAK